MSKLELKVAREEDAELWDRLVESSPHGTIFHTWKWLKIVEKHTNSRLYPLIGYKGTVPVGIFPIFFKKKGLKMIFSPPPGSAIPHLGPTIMNYNALKQSKRESIYKDFQRSVEDFISKLKPHYISVSLTPFMDPRPFIWSGYRLNANFDYYLILTREEEVWKNFDLNLRQHIKRAEKKGIKIEEGSKEDLEFIYDSLLRRYREQKRTVTVPKDYLMELYDAFYPENLKVFIARYEGKNVGGIVALIFKDKIVFWIGAAKPEMKKVSPNDLAQWEAIRWGCSHGLRVYEEIGAGTERLVGFKNKYNPELSIRFTAVKSSLLSSIFEKIYPKLKSFGFHI